MRAGTSQPPRLSAGRHDTDRCRDLPFSDPGRTHVITIVHPPSPTPQPTFLAYLVAAGDSLTTIARRFRTSGRSIAYWNRAIHPSLDPDAATYEPDHVAIGWTLLLIPGNEVDPEDLPPPPPGASPGPTAS